MLGILVLPVFFRIRLGRWYFTEHVCWSALSGSVLNNGVIWRHRSCIQITFYSLSTKSNTFLVFFFTILLSIQCASQCLEECERIVEGHWATPSRSIWGSLSRCGRGSGPGSLVPPGKGSGPALRWVVRGGWVQAEKHKKAWTESREEMSSGWLYSKTGDFFPFLLFCHSYIAPQKPSATDAAVLSLRDLEGCLEWFWYKKLSVEALSFSRLW